VDHFINPFTAIGFCFMFQGLHRGPPKIQNNLPPKCGQPIDAGDLILVD
jgi:hypothetical protein